MVERLRDAHAGEGAVSEGERLGDRGDDRDARHGAEDGAHGGRWLDGSHGEVDRGQHPSQLAGAGSHVGHAAVAGERCRGDQPGDGSCRIVRSQSLVVVGIDLVKAEPCDGRPAHNQGMPSRTAWCPWRP